MAGVSPHGIDSAAPPRQVRATLLAGCSLAGTLLLAAPASAQIGGLLPNLGGNPQIGDLRPQLEKYFRPEDPTFVRPNWIIQPSIELGLGATDNALRSQGAKKADLFAVVTPSLVVSGDTSRIKVNLGYSPTITRYLSASSQNTVAQNGSAQAVVTFVPDTLFLDLRGNVYQQSRTNGFNQVQSQTYNRQNDVQTITLAATPYAEHRFGGWGTGRVGFSIARTLQNAQNGQTLFNTTDNATLAALQAPGTTQGFGATGNLTTRRERASFVSGENLGRFNDIVFVEANQFSGGGSYAGAHRNEIQNELGYALTRTITVLGGLGYQDIRYAGLPGVRIQEPTFNVGVRYSPNPDTRATLLYGRRDGAPSLSFEGQIAPTPRTRVTLRYGTGITSDAENAQSVLDSTSVGATGQLVDTVTGAPVGGASGYGGLQNGIYRVHRLSATGSFLQERDTFSVGITNEDRTSLTTTTGLLLNGTIGSIAAGTSTNSTYASLDWQHDLSPDMKGGASIQYGITNTTSQLLAGSSQQQRTFSFSASLSKQFTQTLTGSVRYILNDQTGGPTASTAANNTGTYTQNTVLVSLRKGF